MLDNAPRVFRSMKEDDGYPTIGQTARTLGVRIVDKNTTPVNPDIAVDDNGDVSPNSGGMSVAPNWRSLPLHRIPRRLNEKLEHAGAAGNNKDRCWRAGEKAFSSGKFCENLILDVDRSDHGTIQPAELVEFFVYESALHATRTSWVIDEN